MQDLLAMTALQLASKSDNKSTEKSSVDVSGIEEQLQKLSDELDEI